MSSITLCFRWQYKLNDKWKTLNKDECQQLERDFNSSQKDESVINPTMTAYPLKGNKYSLLTTDNDVYELKRNETFEGQIIKTMNKDQHGYVSYVFSNNSNYGMKFFYSYCKNFDAYKINIGDTITYKLRYFTKPVAEYRAYDCFKVNNINNNNDNNNYKQYSKYKQNYQKQKPQKRNYNYNKQYRKFNENHLGHASIRPIWHPQYMSMKLNGYLKNITKYKGHLSGTIQRQKGSKINDTESDLINFYFNHCSSTFLNQYKHVNIPAFVSFKIGYIPGQKNSLLAHDVEFDVELPKRVPKISGEIIKIPQLNNNINRNGWIYNSDNNWMYCFISNSHQHFNVGNIVYFNIEIKKNQNTNLDEYWAKDGSITISKRYDPSILPFLYDDESQCMHDNTKRLFIKGAQIDLREDLTTEFKQFKALNGYLNVIKICEIMLKYMNAFVNTVGGTIYFGINDDRIICGEEYCDDKAIDNIKVYIDNRLRQWKPQTEYEKLKNAWKLEFIPVILRNPDNYCFKLPDLYVIKASITAIKLDNNCKFKNHDKKSWTRNLASIGKILSQRSSVDIDKVNNNDNDDNNDYKDNDNKNDDPEPDDLSLDTPGGIPIKKIENQLKDMGIEVDPNIIEDVFISQNCDEQKAANYLAYLYST